MGRIVDNSSTIATGKRPKGVHALTGAHKHLQEGGFAPLPPPQDILTEMMGGEENPLGR